MKRRNCYRALAGSTVKFLFHSSLAAAPLKFSQQLISRFGSPSERGEKTANRLFLEHVCLIRQRRMLVQVRIENGFGGKRNFQRSDAKLNRFC